MTRRKAGQERRIFSAVTAVYLAALFGAYLLYSGVGGYQMIAAQKWNAYLLITGAYLAAMLLLRLEMIAVGAAGRLSLRSAWRSLDLTQKLVLAYLCAAAVSTLCSQFRHTAVWGGGRHEGFVAIALYCLSFLTVSRCVEPRRWMLWLFAGAFSVNCAVCLIQLAGYNPLGLYPDGMNYYDGNIRYAAAFLGTVGNADILSAMLSLTIPAVWLALLKTKEIRHRVVLLVILTLCLMVLLKSFVAGGILGTAGAMLLSLPLVPDGSGARKRMMLGVIALLAVLAAAVYCFGGQLGGFLYEASELMHGRWKDDFGSGRLYIWRDALRLVPEHPLLGGGPDTLGLRTEAAFERYDEALGVRIHSAVDNAHNEYLNILVNQGAVGLACYLAVLIAAAREWVRSSASSIVATVCGAAALGYCIQAFFGLSSPISTPYLWMALALLQAAGKTAQSSTL